MFELVKQLSPIRLYAYGAIALAAMGAFLYLRHIQVKADRTEAAEKALADYGKHVAERDKQAAADKAAADERAKKLRHSVDDAQMLIERLRKQPPQQTVKYVQTGEPCPSVRLDPEFVRDWNSISAASAVPDTG